MNDPKTLHIDTKAVDNVVTLWREGGVVAIPTETVYGLAADATNGEAVARIYALKSRPSFNPLIVHVADVETAKQYVQWNEMAQVLAVAFWPGPMTLVLKKKLPVASRQPPEIHELVSAGGDTLAIRIPAHPVALQLLHAFGGGISAPSANRSGRVSPTTAQHVRDEFGDEVLIIDGGACEVGLESTVIDVTGTAPVILRPGSVTQAMVEKVASRQSPIASNSEAGSIVPPPTGGSSLAAPSSPTLKSPGMLESHYAPATPVRMQAHEVTADEALLAFGETPFQGACRTLNLSPTGDLVEAAANLFAYLRALDNAGATAIAVMPIPNEGLGVAINDRLRRASAPR
jgi:L-threonylcarbamoyladenylate synthase